MTRLMLIFWLALSSSSIAADWPRPEVGMQMPFEVFKKYRNPDGSCVQCSIGMVGVWMNQPAAANLLWDSDYGPKVRGGSGPSRVKKYCNARNIPVWNITGHQTIEWMEWAAKNRRFAAIGAGGNHFQTLVGMSDDRQTFYVLNNNSPHKVTAYSRSAFIALHKRSGHWCVIIKGPAPMPTHEIRPTVNPMPTPKPRPKWSVN